jgi:hypothetical protein
MTFQESIKKLIFGYIKLQFVRAGMREFVERFEHFREDTEKKIRIFFSQLLLGIVSLLFVSIGFIFLILALFFYFADQLNYVQASLYTGGIAIGVGLVVLVLGKLFR